MIMSLLDEIEESRERGETGSEISATHGIFTAQTDRNRVRNQWVHLSIFGISDIQKRDGRRGEEKPTGPESYVSVTSGA
jgi:hypothetical protein